MHNYLHHGFTLIELLIAIAIVGILTAIALPSYQKQVRKAHYTEVIQATSALKLDVEECFQITDDLENCKAGKNGIPKEMKTKGKKRLVNTISVGDNGIITATPRDLYGIKPTDLYILTPTVKNNQLIWSSSGKGVTNGYAR